MGRAHIFPLPPGKSQSGSHMRLQAVVRDILRRLQCPRGERCACHPAASRPRTLRAISVLE
eukprot:4813008-Prymnesium_polylepis.1